MTSTKAWISAALLLSLAVVVGGEPVSAEESPYASFVSRDIKALSPQEIGDYLAGRGMGLALAAELNGYPGPKHVLELAAELDLSAEQKTAMRRIFERMLADAIELGENIVAVEERLDASFAAGDIAASEVVALVEEIGLLGGRLRGVHLLAHLETVEVLSPAQRRRYAELRGYESGHHDPSHSHHGHNGGQDGS